LHALARLGDAARANDRLRALTEQLDRPLHRAYAMHTAAGQVAMLTPRKREVASLAANGLTNREIAEQLVVSARTVEHHLEHAYQKLGVNDRGELTTLLSARLTGEGP